jgi:hypothetical protein
MADEKKPAGSVAIKSLLQNPEAFSTDIPSPVIDPSVDTQEVLAQIPSEQEWAENREAMLSTMARNVYTKLFGDDVVFLIPEHAPYYDQYKWGWIPLVNDDVEFEQAVEAGFTKDLEHWLHCTNILDFQQRLAHRDIVVEYREAMDAREPVDMAVLSNPDNFVKQPPVWRGGTTDQPQGYIEPMSNLTRGLDGGLLERLVEGKTLGMQILHPAEGQLDAQTQLVVDRLLVFYNRVNPNTQEGFGTVVDPTIFTFQGIIGDDEARWIRFQLGDKSQTYAVLDKDFDKFIAGIRDDGDLVWAKGGNYREEWQKKGLHLNVSKTPIELPLSWMMRSMFNADPMEGLVDGDFTDLDGHVKRLKNKVAENLRDITQRALSLINVDGKRDHDLYLVFKAPDKAMQTLNVSLEKVYPLLPESGEINVGDNPINIFEWNVDKKSLVTAKQIIVLAKHTNNDIEKTRKLISQHPVIQAEFAQEVKTLMFAASHFTKKLYGCKPEDVEDMVMHVTDNVVRRLTTKGGRIGLDLNSWIVWEYHDDRAPTKVVDPELDFTSLILNRYTESFVEALYSYLLNLGNPFIKPYDYRVKADISDGIEVGSIRRV